MLIWGFILEIITHGKKKTEIKAVHPKFMNGDGAFFWPSHGVFVPCLGHGRHGIDFEYLTRRF